jgi:hypothetical protein
VAEYRYHFYDSATGTLIDTLPLEEVSFKAELRGVGTCSGTLPLFADDLNTARVLEATIPHRTKLYVERDNALVWGGRVVPPRGYESGTGRLSINAEDTIGALAYRLLPNLAYTATDQFAIFRGIVAALQAETGGDLGLLVDTHNSGILRDRTYLQADRTVALEALSNLSEVIDGFDFATQVVWDETAQPQERIVLAHPRMGRVGPQSGLVLEHDRVMGGGNVVSYTWSDGPGLFTRSWASSENEEGAQMAVSATNSELLGQGYPLLEQIENFSGITQLNTLLAHAQAMSAYAAGHRVTAGLTVKAAPGLVPGDWQMGDDVLVRLSDPRFPPDPVTGAPGFADYMRIVGWEISPGPVGAETIDFTVADFLEAL